MKAHKTSPDAWMQMTKQLAYGKMHNGQPAVTYESAQTRKFKLGRTEVIRSASNESKAFVQAMLKEGVSVCVYHFAISALGLTLLGFVGYRTSQAVKGRCQPTRPVLCMGSRRSGCRPTHVWSSQVVAKRRGNARSFQGSGVLQDFVVDVEYQSAWIRLPRRLGLRRSRAGWMGSQLQHWQRLYAMGHHDEERPGQGVGGSSVLGGQGDEEDDGQRCGGLWRDQGQVVGCDFA